MKLTHLVTPALAFAMLAGVAPVFAAPSPSPAVAPYQDRGFQDRDHGSWDTPPAEYNEYRQQGFRDGIEGARRDAENHRPFTPQNRDEYRHPNVPRNVYRDYREAFREGYHRAMQNMHHDHDRDPR